MSTLDALMQPYVDARDLDDAAAELDRLTPGPDLPARVLGDYYDDLAEAAAEEDDYPLAARLQRRAIQLGCDHQQTARRMLGWYLLKAGRTDEGESEFALLRTGGAEDVDLLTTLANARSDAGLQDAALAALDEAVALAKRLDLGEELDWARIERRGERECMGLPLDEDDRLAPTRGPLITGEQTAWTLAWFAPDQHAAALARWPSLGDDLADPVAYNLRLEEHLRHVHRETGRRPSIAPVDVDELAAWAERERYDAGTGTARSLFAAQVARDGAAVDWPPGRNAPCWCRSGRKYKRCCGAG